MHRLYSMVIAAAISLMSSAAYADSSPIGYVKTHAGAAFVHSGSAMLEAVQALVQCGIAGQAQDGVELQHGATMPLPVRRLKVAVAAGGTCHGPGGVYQMRLPCGGIP